MSKRIWKSVPLTWKSWGQESIVFNGHSGNTHLISPIAAKILKISQVQPYSADEICRKISTDFQLEPDEEILQRVEVVLETLDDLGLIETVPR